MKFRIGKPSAKVMRRTLTGLAICLALGGIGLVAYPFATDLWAARIQGGLAQEFASPQAAQQFRSGNIPVGSPVTRIEIPKIGVDTLVVEGTSLSALRAGAGHYPETPLPGERGNVAIAGHRTTYGRPFANLDRLKNGDAIILETPVGTCTYQVTREPFIIAPTDFSVVANDPAQQMLTLTTCHPKGSAAKRLVIQATLTQGAGQSA